jgi:hypothetical protein
MQKSTVSLLFIALIICSSVLVTNFHAGVAQSSSTEWQFQTVDPVKTQRHDNSLELDSQGNPHIIYFSGSEQLRYASYTGTGWSSLLVDPKAYDAAFALDSDDSPYIVYYSYTTHATVLAHLINSQWQIQPIDSGISFNSPSITVNSANYPEVSYYDSQNANLIYAKYDGSTWTKTIVDSTGDVGDCNSITIDKLGNPHISYYDATNSGLKYASWTGTTWAIETAYTGLGIAVRSSSLGIDDQNNPHIAFFDYQNNAVKYAYNNGIGWSTETVFSTTSWSSTTCALALDSHDIPHITCASAHNGIIYATKSGLGWTIEAITNSNDIFMYSSSLALNSNDAPFISYVGQQNSDLYVRCATPVANQYQITFNQNGVTSGYTGTILTVDNQLYLESQLPVTFLWATYSTHTYAYTSSLDTGPGTRYVWTSTSGLSDQQSNTFSVTNSSIITANYKTQYQLNISSQYGNPTGQGWYDAGSTATFNITSPSSNTAGTQYIFTNWTGTGAGSISNQNTANSLQMNNPITETANWKTQYLTSIIAIPPNAGTVSPAVSNDWKDSGALSISATANSGYAFLGWYSSTGSTSFSNNGAASSTAIINGPDTMIANFVPISTPTPSSYNIMITHIGEGTVTPSDGTYSNNPSAQLTLTAAPAENYSFMCWLQNGTILSETNPFSYTVVNSYVITAVFYDPVAKDTSSSTPSPSPTTTPTATPTTNPTQAPASNPTTNPTQQPTSNPTTSPTTQPTNTPTQNDLPTPTPTVPEYQALIIVPFLLSLLSTAILLNYRKIFSK